MEDETPVRDLTRRILESAGYTTIAAANGGEALLLLERTSAPVHLLITDLVMPGMSGRELSERLGHLRPEMKVLYTSGYTDDAVVRHGLVTHRVHFISKPYSRVALTTKVRQVLDSE